LLLKQQTPYVKVEWVNMSIMQHAWTGNGIDIIVRGGSKYFEDENCV
jgi:hypothetical protein